MPGFIARADIDVDASPDRVWQYITVRASEVSFGAQVESDWRPGSSVRWHGEWKGEPFEDKGEVIEAVAPYRLVITHFSPLTGDDDVPENYHRITYELSGAGDGTHVELAQDGNRSDRAASEAAANWHRHLEAIKEKVEG